MPFLFVSLCFFFPFFFVVSLRFFPTFLYIFMFLVSPIFFVSLCFFTLFSLCLLFPSFFISLSFFLSLSFSFLCVYYFPFFLRFFVLPPTNLPCSFESFLTKISLSSYITFFLILFLSLLLPSSLKPRPRPPQKTHPDEILIIPLNK